VKKLLAVLLGTVAGLVLCELATRLLSDRLLGLSHPAVRFDPELGWVQREGEAGIRRNEAGQEVAIVGSPLGIRRPPQPYATEGRETVLVVGDSFTAGTQLPFGDTWAAKLEARLRLRHPTVQVVNAGVDRYDLSQSARLAARMMERFHPRHIVVAVYLGNDVIDYERDGQGRSDGWLWRHSYFLHYVRGALSRRGRGGHEDEPKAPSAVEGWSPRSVPAFAELRADQQARIRGQFAAGDVLPVWRGGEEGERRIASTERQLDRFRGMARAASASLTVLLLPMKQEVIPEQRAELLALHHLADADIEHLHQRLATDVAPRDVYDVTAELRAYPQPVALFWTVDLHMTALGHALVAERLALRMERTWDGP
jgi:lysophospholipase L1-like esterase